MPGNDRLDKIAKVVESVQERLVSQIESLRKNVSALSAGGISLPPRPKKEVIRAIRKLRTALNSALLKLEKRIQGTGGKKKSAARRRKTAAA